MGVTAFLDVFCFVCLFLCWSDHVRTQWRAEEHDQIFREYRGRAHSVWATPPARLPRHNSESKNVRKWHERFREGTDHAVRGLQKSSGASGGAHRRRPCRDIAQRVNISKSSTHTILKKDLKLSPRFIPKDLTAEQKQFWVRMCELNMQAWRMTTTTSTRSWLGMSLGCLFSMSRPRDHHECEWHPKGSTAWRPTKPLPRRSEHKSMLTVFFDESGEILIDFKDPRVTVYAYNSCNILRSLKEQLRRCRPDKWANRNFLHHDNASPTPLQSPCHSSALVALRWFPIPPAAQIWLFVIFVFFPGSKTSFMDINTEIWLTCKLLWAEPWGASPNKSTMMPPTPSHSSGWNASKGMVSPLRGYIWWLTLMILAWRSSTMKKTQKTQNMKHAGTDSDQWTRAWGLLIRHKLWHVFFCEYCWHTLEWLWTAWNAWHCLFFMMKVVLFNRRNHTGLIWHETLYWTSLVFRERGQNWGRTSSWCYSANLFVSGRLVDRGQTTHAFVFHWIYFFWTNAHGWSSFAGTTRVVSTMPAVFGAASSWIFAKLSCCKLILAFLGRWTRVPWALSCQSWLVCLFLKGPTVRNTWKTKDHFVVQLCSCMMQGSCIHLSQKWKISWTFFPSCSYKICLTIWAAEQTDSGTSVEDVPTPKLTKDKQAIVNWFFLLDVDTIPEKSNRSLFAACFWIHHAAGLAICSVSPCSLDFSLTDMCTTDQINGTIICGISAKGRINIEGWCRAVSSACRMNERFCNVSGPPWKNSLSCVQHFPHAWLRFRFFQNDFWIFGSDWFRTRRLDIVYFEQKYRSARNIMCCRFQTKTINLQNIDAELHVSQVQVRRPIHMFQCGNQHATIPYSLLIGIDLLVNSVRVTERRWFCPAERLFLQRNIHFCTYKKFVAKSGLILNFAAFVCLYNGSLMENTFRAALHKVNMFWAVHHGACATSLQWIMLEQGSKAAQHQWYTIWLHVLCWQVISLCAHTSQAHFRGLFEPCCWTVQMSHAIKECCVFVRGKQSLSCLLCCTNTTQHCMPKPETKKEKDNTCLFRVPETDWGRQPHTILFCTRGLLARLRK